MPRVRSTSAANRELRITREPSGRLDELGLVGAADWMCRTMMANGQTIAAVRLRRRPVARARLGRVAVTALIAIAVLARLPPSS
jgi:hypothetical protein